MENHMRMDRPLDNEVDLRRKAALIWAHKKAILTVTALLSLIALLVALLMPNRYLATAVIFPAQTSSSPRLGAMAAQFGGLASLAGIQMPSDESGETQAAMEIMQSWSFIEKFIETHDLSADVFAADGWDKETNKLTYDASLYDSQQRIWVRSPPAGKTIEPTSWELFEEFSELLTVATDETTGMVHLSMKHYSPEIAKHWLDLYITSLNEYMRERKLTQTNSNITYLEAQIEKTAIAGMKEVFYQIIEEQIKNKMLAEASPEYAFVTVSPAMVPEEPYSPKRVLIFFLAVFFGLMVSITGVLLIRDSD